MSDVFSNTDSHLVISEGFVQGNRVVCMYVYNLHILPML